MRRTYTFFTGTGNYMCRNIKEIHDDVKCEDCNGRGHNEDGQECPECEGEGFVERTWWE